MCFSRDLLKMELDGSLQGLNGYLIWEQVLDFQVIHQVW